MYTVLERLSGRIPALIRSSEPNRVTDSPSNAFSFRITEISDYEQHKHNATGEYIWTCSGHAKPLLQCFLQYITLLNIPIPERMNLVRHFILVNQKHSWISPSGNSMNQTRLLNCNKLISSHLTGNRLKTVTVPFI